MKRLPPLQAPARLGVGDRVVVRTRLGGLRELKLRLVRGGRRGGYLIGSDGRDLCHRAWLRDIVYVERVRR